MRVLGDIIIEGKSKKFYDLGNNVCFMVFKPHLRSITHKREENIEGTDHERLIANTYIMKYLSEYVQTHLVSREIQTIEGMEGLLVEKVKPIPIEFICRYYAAGSILKLGIVKEGDKFKQPLYKYDLKQDISMAGVDDPMLNESYIVGLGLLTQEQFDTAKSMLVIIGEKINELLKESDMKLIDMKMEFGFNNKNDIVLIDEISQDCIRANDLSTNVPLTKDAFRNLKTPEEVLNAYKEFNKRIQLY